MVTWINWASKEYDLLLSRIVYKSVNISMGCMLGYEKRLRNISRSCEFGRMVVNCIGDLGLIRWKFPFKVVDSFPYSFVKL